MSVPTNRAVLTIRHMMKANRAAGHHFFDPDTMKFWQSRVEPDIYECPTNGLIGFVTSEVLDGQENGVRTWAPRWFDPNTGRVLTRNTVRYPSAEAAWNAIFDEVRL